MNVDSITVRSNITEKIYQTYMNFHVYKRDKSWIKLPICCAIIAVFAVCNFIASSPILGWIFLTLAFYLLISRFLRFYMSVNRICMEYKLNQIPKLFYTVTLSRSGIDVVNEKEKANYSWDQVYHVYRRKDIIYLYLNSQNAFLLPFDELDGGSAEDLWALITSILSADKVTDIAKQTKNLL
ncbi:MAG: YcxB family protein [Lachnospiraceae bacterium]|nr:YcxB family protein [Lachnospiraceae bacterium]